MSTSQEDLIAEIRQLSASKPRGPKSKFTESQQLMFLKAYLSNQMTSRELFEKFGVRRVHLFRWKHKFAKGNTHPGASHPGASAAEPAADACPTFNPIPSPPSMPSKKKPSEKVSQSEDLSRLQEENQRLRDQLQMSQWMVHARDVMIEEAEKTFKIAIRKKSGAKQ